MERMNSHVPVRGFEPFLLAPGRSCHRIPGPQVLDVPPRHGINQRRRQSSDQDMAHASPLAVSSQLSHDDLLHNQGTPTLRKESRARADWPCLAQRTTGDWKP